MFKIKTTLSFLLICLSINSQPKLFEGVDLDSILIKSVEKVNERTGVNQYIKSMNELLIEAKTKEKIMEIGTTIDIKIANIKADKRYFYFDFEIRVNGELKIKDSYSDDYDGEDKKEIKKSLKNGYAQCLILENYANELFDY